MNIVIEVSTLANRVKIVNATKIVIVERWIKTKLMGLKPVKVIPKGPKARENPCVKSTGIAPKSAAFVMREDGLMTYHLKQFTSVILSSARNATAGIRLTATDVISEG